MEEAGLELAMTSTVLIPCFVSMAFVVAAGFHALALAWPALAEPEPAWRHGLFIAINIALAVGVWFRPPWFAAMFLVVTAQQLVSHGASAWHIWHDEHRIDWASAMTLPFIAGTCAWLLRDAWLRRRSNRR